jgi:hypothetical protein
MLIGSSQLRFFPDTPPCLAFARDALSELIKSLVATTVCAEAGMILGRVQPAT